jgi:hypothetical protein
LDFLSAVDGALDSDMQLLASHFYELSVYDFDHVNTSVLEAILSDPSLVVEDEDSVFDVVHRRASDDSDFFALLEFVRFEFLSDECMKTAFEFISNSFESLTLGVWSGLRTRLTLPVTPASGTGRFKSGPTLDSKIISTFPNLFSVFGHKRFQLLYRGSRDGFGVNAFHSRCNGHANTVTLVLSKNESVFGGFTPVSWTSRNEYAADPRVQSFIFTIKNPHKLPERIFKLKQASTAISDCSSYGPTFGSGYDFHLCDQCQSVNDSYSILGNSYANDTGIAGNQVLTGAEHFTVKEIEVFEVV